MFVRKSVYRVILVFTLGLASIPTSSFVAAADITFETSQISIVTKDGTYNLSVELAVNKVERARGLMSRKEMPPNAGMLFDFERNELVTMWMKNTFISLDMLFLDSFGTIVSITRDTQPQSLRQISSAGPVRGVLELNAGTVNRLGIKEGDRILHARFGGRI